MQSRYVVAPAAIILFAPLLASCGGHVTEASAATREPARRVNAVAVAERDVPSSLRLTGSLEANRDSDVAADASGRVAATFVERGDYVKKGAVLARLDARSAALGAAQAKADAEAARADARLRVTELERTERLVAQRALADAELDRARSQRDATEQRASAAEARVALQDKSVGDALVRAPFDGVIAERWVDEGEYVRPDTRVVTLVDVDTLRLKLTVPEAAVSAVRAGQRVAFRVASEPEAPREAEVRYIGPHLRASSRELVVEAVVDNRDRRLKPGMFATASVEAGAQRVLVLPAAAVKREGATNHVFVLAKGRLEERVVQLGARSGDDLVVVAGAAVGERVVAPLVDDLRDGQPAE